MQSKFLLIIPAIIQLLTGVLGLAGSLVMLVPMLSKGPKAYLLLFFLLIPIVLIVISIGLFVKKNWAIMVTPIVSIFFLMIQIFIMLTRDLNIMDGVWVVFLLICIACPWIYQLNTEKT